MTLPKLAIIDPFIKSPEVDCYNRLSNLLELPTYIHHPSVLGLNSLRDLRAKTDVYVVLGSASNVTEPLDWHQPLAEFLSEELERRKPVLGLCFGHQLMCHFFGSQVDYHWPNQEKFRGLREIKMTKAFGELEAGEMLHLPVSHKQVVKTLSSEMESIGIDPHHRLEFDLVRHKRVPFVGSQPHPEASVFFCLNSANVPEDKIAGALKNGDRVIRSFFKEYDLRLGTQR